MTANVLLTLLGICGSISGPRSAILICITLISTAKPKPQLQQDIINTGKMRRDRNRVELMERKELGASYWW